MDTIFSAAQGQFILNRVPLRPHETLRAWDAADELALDYLNENHNNALIDSARVLIVNDQFGALSIALNKTQLSNWSDSFIAHQAVQFNSKQNDMPPVQCISSIADLNGTYDFVIIKVQKSLAQLEDQLHRLRPHLTANTVIIGCSMVKMLHNSTLALFENIIGNTTTSLAKKKARLIFCQFDPALSVNSNPYPQSFTLDYREWDILNHANVFSRAKLDIGCRFFMQNLPSIQKYKRIIDLGCGSGIIGMVAASLHPNAQIDFYDESYMAVASAEHNFKQYFTDHQQVSFQVDDCLTSREHASADLILNNPPFHQQNAIGDFIAMQMFKQSFKTLTSGGELWVIGNSHLQYQQKLKKIFNNCESMVANNKFVILRAIKK
jgi:16S rRNA (guanine1207-N2)-methyltransferase